MAYLGLFLVQLAAQIGLLIYWKRRWEAKTNPDQFRREIEQLIIAFNQYADRNISILEDRKSQAEVVLRQIEEALSEQRKTKFFRSAPSKGVAAGVAASTKKPAEKLVARAARVRSKNNAASKSPSKPVVKAAKANAASRGDLKDYFHRKELQALESMSLEERLMHYRSKNLPMSEIASLLKISIDEANLMTALGESQLNKP